jgi:mRNA interferase RelE/StbE
MPWHLAITRRAAKDLDALPPPDRDEVERRLERAVDDPGSADVRKLGGRGDEWRLRVGRWRVILRLETATGTIYALRVLPRSRAYRD